MIEELLAGRPTGGRHALDEDAVQTPIFAALRRGGWRARPERPESVEEFHRDPLTAPLPIQLAAAVRPAAATVTGGVIVEMTAGAGRRRSQAATERSAPREWAGLDALADTGRHHLRPVANW